METEKTGGIYRIYHKESMKSYIGKSVRPTQRISSHFAGYGNSPILHAAIKKYGTDAFCVEILEKDMPEAVLSKLEILHIRFFNCKAPNGYNLTDGGEGASGRQISPETCRKVSEAGKGRQITPETRRKISEVNTGKKRSLETRQKMSEDRKGRIPWNKGKTGPYSNETLQRMSESQKGNSSKKGKKLSPEQCRKISKSKKREKHPNWGKSLSSETRRKISESLKRRNCSA